MATLHRAAKMAAAAAGVAACYCAAQRLGGLGNCSDDSESTQSVAEEGAKEPAAPADAEPWMQDLRLAMATAQSELQVAHGLATRCSEAVEKLKQCHSIDRGPEHERERTALQHELDTSFASCVAELARVATMQGDGFTAVFERVKVALKMWAAIPNDPRLSGEWNMAPDRGVADELITACGPPFKVVWWRVLQKLGRIPRSHEADDLVTVNIFYIHRVQAGSSCSERA
eukprot:SAG11_NODE_38_length_21705_cov_24.667453_10_plen_229_part_00